MRDDVGINPDMIGVNDFMGLVSNTLNSCLINKFFLFLPFLLPSFVSYKMDVFVDSFLNAKFISVY
jgi:hypothetical protein